MPSFAQTFTIRTSPEAVWALLSDIPRMAGLFPYLVVTELTSVGEGCWRYWRTLTIPGMPALRWREEASLGVSGTLSFRALEGDVKVFTGSWRITSNEGITGLTLTVDYEFPEGVGGGLPMPLLLYAMGELLKAMGQRVCDMAENQA